MTTHTLWAKVYHIAQKTLQFFWVASIAMVFYRAIKILLRSIDYSTNPYSFLLNKNSLTPTRVLKYACLINQTGYCARFSSTNLKDEIC